MIFAMPLILIDTQMRAHTNLLITIGILSLFRLGRRLYKTRTPRILCHDLYDKDQLHHLYCPLFAISMDHLFAGRLQDMIVPYIAFIIVFAIVMAVSIPLSTFTYYRIELPFVRYRRNVFARNQVVGPRRNASR